MKANSSFIKTVTNSQDIFEPEQSLSILDVHEAFNIKGQQNTIPGYSSFRNLW